MSTYTIVRMYMHDHPTKVMKTGLTLQEAQEYCKDPETSSRTCTLPDNVAHTAAYGDWFDGYREE